MTLEQAVTILKDRAKINKVMCPKPKSDFDEFCLYEATAIDVVLKELEK